MKAILSLGLTAAFLGGFALALLISYPIPENSTYVCFVALFVAMIACALGGWSMVLEATKRNRVQADGLIEATIDRLKRRGLNLIERD